MNNNELDEVRLFSKGLQRNLRKKANTKFKRSNGSKDITVKTKTRDGLLDRIQINLPKHIQVHNYGVKPKRVRETVRPHSKKGKKSLIKVSKHSRLRKMELISTPILAEAVNENNSLDKLADKISEIRADKVIANMNFKL